MLVATACAGLSAYAYPAELWLITSAGFTAYAKLWVSLFYVLVLFLAKDAGDKSCTISGFALIAVFLLVSSRDWFLFFMCLELLTLSSYCVIALSPTRRSLESVLKYFSAGAVSTCFLLLGATLAYMACGSASFEQFPDEYYPALGVSVFIFASLALKAGSAPFHYWVADVYEGSPAFATSFLAVFVKVSTFLVIVRVLFGPLADGAPFWGSAIQVCAGVSMLVGCFGALFQKRVKRILAYSSVSNAGFLLSALACGNFSGVETALVYLGFYCASLAIFLRLLDVDPSPVTYVSDLSRLRASESSAPLAALALFSMAGIPPLTGFWIKFFVLKELIGSSFFILATIAALTSVVSSFYYVGLVRSMYFETPAESVPYAGPFSGLGSAVAAAPFLAYPLAPDLIQDGAHLMARSLLI